MLTNHITSPTLIAQGFHALSDPIRISVIELLRQKELCVCDLSDYLGVNQSKLSFHLKTLKEVCLVNSRQEGRWIYYSLNIRQFEILEAYLTDFRQNHLVSARRSCDD
ncbi:metalloregulator ArsR/SmtB family transcription factor [Cronbergia sp. UHCC 0137]|uniref:ArsR/SmtB family transcription factor n=1 Tax=Cronbergia sp. UHCC 0137 TaxID=3110239 RepID=UPI002B21589A|nr:metalloregulator ArsR/SmtB family transcription factor [Cronbergia sp. UHCC 0137]MEA5617570.1 metalloregulator ArsR/SmtB family transcription factor [Cronbergia sp. UHCC 0137]